MVFFLYKMGTHFSMRTYGVNQVFRVVQGNLVTLKELSNPKKKKGKDQFHIIRAQHVLSYHRI